MSFVLWSRNLIIIKIMIHKWTNSNNHKLIDNELILTWLYVFIMNIQINIQWIKLTAIVWGHVEFSLYWKPMFPVFEIIRLKVICTVYVADDFVYLYRICWIPSKVSTTRKPTRSLWRFMCSLMPHTAWGEEPYNILFRQFLFGIPGLINGGLLTVSRISSVIQ